MTSLTALTVEAEDAPSAEKFYADAFGLGDRLNVDQSDAATSGFRGFTVSLLVSQPANAHALFDAAVSAGATVLKPVEKSMWGVGGVIQAPDGAIWKLATSSKKDSAPASRDIDSVVVLFVASDVSASKTFYVEHGLKIGRSFGSYVEFAMPGSPIGLGLYKRAALAKDAGVPADGSGSHRIAITSDAGAFTDPDGFTWR
ncbi:MAG: glyoxalase [Actinomycetota bacterium]